MPTPPTPPPSVPLLLEDVRAIARLLHEADLSEIEIETVDAASSTSSTSGSSSEGAEQAPPRVRLQMRRGTDPSVARRTMAAAPAAARPPKSAASPAPEGLGQLEKGSSEVLSPGVGIFRALQPPVAVGDEVKAGQKAGAVEALKVPTDILFELAGRVTQVLADDGSGVEYAQPLFLLEPSD